MSPFQTHIELWKKCRLCPLCETRKNVVGFRGDIPCDVLFVGEAPGDSEDVMGKPFKGPAGQLLDTLIERALGVKPGVKIGFANLIGCIPKGGDGKKEKEPPIDSIKKCSPRLKEIIEMARPRLIITVGQYADTWTPKATQSINPGSNGQPIPDWASIIHPAAILRDNLARQSLAKQRCVIIIKNAVEALGE